MSVEAKPRIATMKVSTRGGSLVTRIVASAVLSVIPLSGCTRNPEVVTESEAAPAIEGLPLRLRVEQRTTTSIPGSHDRLKLTIDDITRGQAMVAVIDDSGKCVLGPVSMRRGDAQTWVSGASVLRLRLEEFDLTLLGTDHAEFVIEAAPKQAALAEHEKIELLIVAVERLDAATFLRNGSEYESREAAEHLRRKLAAAGDDIETAGQFIERIAARSSLSGEEYRLRFSDGRVITLRDFLAERLAAM